MILWNRGVQKERAYGRWPETSKWSLHLGGHPIKQMGIGKQLWVGGESHPIKKPHRSWHLDCTSFYTPLLWKEAGRRTYHQPRTTSNVTATDSKTRSENFQIFWNPGTNKPGWEWNITYSTTTFKSGTCEAKGGPLDLLTLNRPYIQTHPIWIVSNEADVDTQKCNFHPDPRSHTPSYRKIMSGFDWQPEKVAVENNAWQKHAGAGENQVKSGSLNKQ